MFTAYLIVWIQELDTEQIWNNTFKQNVKEKTKTFLWDTKPSNPGEQNVVNFIKEGFWQRHPIDRELLTSLQFTLFSEAHLVFDYRDKAGPTTLPRHWQAVATSGDVRKSWAQTHLHIGEKKFRLDCRKKNWWNFKIWPHSESRIPDKTNKAHTDKKLMLMRRTLEGVNW